MSGWGSDLWDRGEVVITRTLAEADELGTALPRYLKDRGEVEREYAKALRKLVAKYQVKEGKKEGSTETTQSQGFKSVLRELGFQAGQHEVLADSLSTTLPAKVKARAKELMKEAERCRKEAKVLAAGQEAEGRAVERAGGKYCRAQGDWETSVANVRRAEEEGQVSRNEEEKLRGLARGKQVQAEEYKARYAQQVVRANQRREVFYTSTLPAVLDSLHAINIERATSWQQTLLEALAAERAVVPILAKCREDMETALVAVSPEADCQLWVERYKTGNVPPGEYQFEDLSSGSNTPSSSGNAKTRTLSRVKSPETGENSNLFPRKRELEKRIASVEAEVAKGQKEMAALQLMVATYRQNPKFGDAAKFQGELEAAILRVQTLESDLHALTSELGEVDRRLALLRLSLPPAYSSNFSTPELRREGSVGSGSAAGSSVCGGSLQSVEQEGIKTNSSSNGSSTGSISSEKDNDSLEEPLEFKTRLSNSQFSINHSQSDSRTSVDNNSNSSELLGQLRQSDLKHAEDEWDLPVDLPPPPLAWETPDDDEVVEALYDFEGETASTLPMRAGELFFLVEADSEGWSKVKRKEGDLEEGYVPTSFLKVL